jgi:undecaprenyl diphosphate synthase
MSVMLPIKSAERQTISKIGFNRVSWLNISGNLIQNFIKFILFIYSSGVKTLAGKSSVFDIINLFGKKETEKRIPKHVAISSEDTLLWMKKNRIGNPKEAFAKKAKIINEIIGMQIKYCIPIVTILVLDDRKHMPEEVEVLQKFFSNLVSAKTIHENQVKISVLGKWYDLPGYLVEEIKHVIDETKDYDRFFLNICMNYSGQEEIVDSCRLIARKIKAGKIDIDAINQELLKDNLYSSYFLPPDIIIKTGTKKTWSSLLLWDSPGAHYYFAGKLFNDLTKQDFEDAIDDFNS